MITLTKSEKQVLWGIAGVVFVVVVVILVGKLPQTDSSRSTPEWLIVLAVLAVIIMAGVLLIKTATKWAPPSLKGCFYMLVISGLFGCWQDSWWAFCFMCGFLLFMEKLVRVMVDRLEIIASHLDARTN